MEVNLVDFLLFEPPTFRQLAAQVHEGMVQLPDRTAVPKMCSQKSVSLATSMSLDEFTSARYSATSSSYFVLASTTRIYRPTVIAASTYSLKAGIAAKLPVCACSSFNLHLGTSAMSQTGLVDFT